MEEIQTQADIIFTPREKEILQLLANYSTNEQMCEELHICWETLMSHFQNIKRKIRLRNGRKVHLIKYAIDHGYGGMATA